MVPLGGRRCRLGVSDFRLACRYAGLRVALYDRKVWIFRALVGLRSHELRFRLFHCYFVIARVKLDKHVSGLDGLILLHMDRFHVAIDPR